MTELPPRLPDEELVRREIGDAALEQREINESAARVIAAWFHTSRDGAFSVFESTGAIDRLHIENEYVTAYNAADRSSFDQLCLDVFGTYLLHAPGIDENGDRGPVEGWDEQTQWGRA